MNIIEKRDFIHSHLHIANENLLNEFYEKLRKAEELKALHERRALKAEEDIKEGRVFSRTEVEQKASISKY
jgi:truncated hemoglobin YjbI